MPQVKAKEPIDNFIENFLCDGLIETPGYSIEKPEPEMEKLDQNECPFDWPQDIKEKTCKKLLSENWNTYPNPYDIELEQKIADFIGLDKNNILLSLVPTIILHTSVCYLESYKVSFGSHVLLLHFMKPIVATKGFLIKFATE